MKKKTKASIVVRYVVVVVVIAAVVVPLRILTSRNKNAYTAPLPAVVVEYPQKQTILSSITLSGHIEARSMVPVVPLVSGTIMEYPVKAGATVRKGELLAQIDPEPFRQQMLQARAAYTGYENSFTRVSGLYSSGAATRQEYDTVKAQRDAAKAQYDLAVLQLGYASVASPVDGTVLAAPLSEGSVASPQQPVAVVADLSDLVVRLDVPEKYFSLFNKSRDSLEAVVTRPGEEGISESAQCTASIDTIAPYIDGASKTFETVLQLEDVPGDFRPGMYVKVTVVFQRHEDVPVLPVSARKTDGSCYLFVMDNAGGESTDMETGATGVSMEKVARGTARHVVLDAAVSDGEWFMVPPEYAECLFIVEGQGTVFNNQPVLARIASDKEEIR